MNYSPNTSGREEPDVAKYIQARAYQLYQERNCEPDHELDDWLIAEHEVRYHFGLELVRAEKPGRD